MRSVEKELLPVMRALAVLLTSGVGLETAMKKISDGDYGEISVQFGNILSEASNSGSLERSLKRAQLETKTDGYRKLLTILVSGSRGEIDIVASLDRLAEREIQVRGVETERFIDVIGARSELFMVLGILIPIIIIIMVFVTTLFENTPFPIGYTITPTMVLLITWVVLSFLTLLVISTKRQEPAI